MPWTGAGLGWAGLAGWAGLGWAGLGWADTAGNNMWQDIADPLQKDVPPTGQLMHGNCSAGKGLCLPMHDCTGNYFSNSQSTNLSFCYESIRQDTVDTRIINTLVPSAALGRFA